MHASRCRSPEQLFAPVGGSLPARQPWVARHHSQLLVRRATRRIQCSAAAAPHNHGGTGTAGLSASSAPSSAAQRSHADSVLARTAADSSRMPLVEALLARAAREHEVPLHVPGHKRGSAAPEGLAAVVGRRALQHDLTELAGLDILSTPSGPIAAAQRAAAAACGADATWFLVNGTTCGLQAAVLATCAPGDALLVARNCHLSAVSAMVLAGCQPVYAQPQYDARWGLAHGVTPASLKAAFASAEAAGRRVTAALVVSPTYFGVCSDIAGLAAVCHARGVPLIVDQAHGAHLHFHPGFPHAAQAGGADVVVESSHKTLAALTQAALLHVCGRTVSHYRVARALQTLQSSSPSYLLMASLDAARAAAAAPGAWDQPLAAAAAARAAACATPGLDVLAAPEGFTLDPLRVTVVATQLGLSGHAALERLESAYGVVAEMATERCVVFAFGAGSTRAHGAALASALRALSAEHAGRAGSGGDSMQQGSQAAAGSEGLPESDNQEGVLELPEVVMTPRQAFFADTERVPLEAAKGRVAAELLCPYPPGVPLLIPGERVGPAALRALRTLRAQQAQHGEEGSAPGLTVAGASDAGLGTLLVMQPIDRDGS